jgi:capsular polysaccharide export protein
VTILFAVNSGHKRFFQKIKKHSKCYVSIVYSKNLFLFSFKSLLFLNQVDFSKAISLKVKDFLAKHDNTIIPIKLLKFQYTCLALYNYMRYFPSITPRYSKIMLWNGMTFRQAIALEIAKIHNIKPIYIENGFLPNRIVIDTKGVNFHNSVPRDITFYQNYSHHKMLPTHLIPRKVKNPKKFSHSLQKELPEKYIFVPFQVDYDTQIMLFSPWITNMRELFTLLEEIAQKVNLNFVFKEHPSSKKDYPDLHKKIIKSSNLYFANNHSTQELIQKSDAVLTINSSVGIESLLFQKKVLVLGEAFYKIEGITIGINSKEELLNTLKILDKVQIDFHIVENFLKYLYFDYLIEGNFKEYNPRQIQRIEEKLACL